MQTIRSIETYGYKMNKDLVRKKDEIQYKNIIKQFQKWLILIMLQKYIKECNSNYPQISNHPYRLLIIAGSESRKLNSLFNLISHQEYIDKIYLYAKDPNKAKYQFLINKRENTDLKYLNESNVFIEYSNDMADMKIWKNTIQIKSKKYWSYLMIWWLICFYLAVLFYCTEKY